MMSKILNSGTLSAFAPDFDPTAPCAATTVLKIVDHSLTAIQDLGIIGTSDAPLRRLDVSGNALVSLEGLKGPLTWLQANNNRLRGRCVLLREGALKL